MARASSPSCPSLLCEPSCKQVNQVHEGNTFAARLATCLSSLIIPFLPPPLTTVATIPPLRVWAGTKTIRSSSTLS